MPRYRVKIGGVMGVPLNYIDNRNDDQFDFIGITESEGKGYSYGVRQPGYGPHPTINRKRTFKRWHTEPYSQS